MCGISGTVSTATEIQSIQNILLKAQGIQQHRGPDSQGIECFNINQWTVGLGHQRLSILDLTDDAKQPMFSSSGNSWIVFNGEIYNYLEIREQLKSQGYSFRTSSDTEVLITALEHWGIDEALSKFNGMWSFAWLDLRTNSLVLCRDRLGVKPLYIYCSHNSLFFGSEIKTLLLMSGRKFQLNYQVVGEYLFQSLLGASNHTFFEGIEEIPPAHYATINLAANSLTLECQSYWQLSHQPAEFSSEASLIETIRELFFDAVRLRLRSDVPIGILLSGGVDSSAIATATQTILGSNNQVKLLAAVSNNPKYDESFFIDIMGDYLKNKVNKVVLELVPETAFDYLEKVCWSNDEPVGSFSNVAHYLLMEKAQELGTTVILSGQGADELLCGYKKYLGFYVQELVRSGKYLQAGSTLSSFWRQKTILNQFSLAEAQRYLPRIFKAGKPDLQGDLLHQFFTPRFLGLTNGCSVLERQSLDISNFSVPALLHYEDRMSMAWAKEIRVPFLDYRLVELLMSVPIEMKLQAGWTKYIFRKAMEPYLPPKITWRKDKQGFVNPQSQWLKNKLKSRVLDFFKEDSLIFRKQLINRSNLLQQYEIFCHDRATTVHFRDVFNPLALEIWLRKFESYIL
jgi:asparagine synthase (glutamine-hydrolysing)